MDLRPLARLVVVSAAASGALVLAGQPSDDTSPPAAPVAGAHSLAGAPSVAGAGVRPAAESVAPAAAPAGPVEQRSTGARVRLEQALRRPAAAVRPPTADRTAPVDESRPHTHPVDPDEGGPVPASSMVGVLDNVRELGPLHIDPMPRGRSVDDPTDTATVLERAGVEPTLAADGAPRTAGATVPVGTPGIPTLASHVAPSCSGTGTDGNRVQVLYVHAAGTVSRYAKVLPALRNEVANVDDVLALSARQTGGERRVRWVHDGSCQPVIHDVTVAASSLGTDFSATIRAVQALGYTQPSRKYLMFADASKMCGVGTVYDDAARTSNPNDGGHASYSRVDVPCWSYVGHSTAAHELIHNLGGVLSTAPNATDHGHCTDDKDLMCYDDDGNTPMRVVCPASQEHLLDCNHDDYFHTSPPAGSFPAQNWNTARSSFLDSTVTTLPPPDVTVSATASTVSTGESVRFTATSSRNVSWAWSKSTSGTACTLTPRAAGQADLQCPSTVSGAVTVTATATHPGASGPGSGQASVTMTQAAAPTAQLTAPASADAGQPFAASVTPSGAGPFAYSWSAPTCTLSSGAAASTAVTCSAGTTDRDVTLSVLVTQADGQSVPASTTVRIPATVTSTPTPTATPTPTPTPTTTSWTTPALVSGTVSARLRDQSGAALPGQPVTLQVRWSGTTTWRTALQLTTDATGRAAARLSTSRAGWFRFAKADDPTRLGSVSPAVYVKVATRMAISAPAGHRLVGTLRTSTGHPVAGARVTLERRVPGTRRWVPVVTLRTSAQGRVSTRVDPARRTSFRWAFRGQLTHLRALSSLRTLT